MRETVRCKEKYFKQTFSNVFLLTIVKKSKCTTIKYTQKAKLVELVNVEVTRVLFKLTRFWLIKQDSRLIRNLINSNKLTPTEFSSVC